MHRLNIMCVQFLADFFGELADVVGEGTGIELQVVVDDQIFDFVHGEWDAHGDADGAHGQQLHYALDIDRSVGANPLRLIGKRTICGL